MDVDVGACRLRQDLKDVVSQQLEGGGSVPGTSANIPSTSSAPSVANLQHQLRLALQVRTEKSLV